MKTIHIHHHWRDRAVSRSFANVLAKFLGEPGHNSITSGVHYPLGPDTHSVLLWSSHWDHIVQRFWMERLDQLVGKPPVAPMTVIMLSADSLGMVAYLQDCGASVQTVSTGLAGICANDTAVSIGECVRDNRLGRAIIGAISHREGAAYTASMARLMHVLPWLPDVAIESEL